MTRGFKQGENRLFIERLVGTWCSASEDALLSELRVWRELVKKRCGTRFIVVCGLGRSHSGVLGVRNGIEWADRSQDLS